MKIVKKMCIEVLVHFRCCDCDGYWAISDFNRISSDVIYCPHCNCEQLIDYFGMKKPRPTGDGIDRGKVK